MTALDPLSFRILWGRLVGVVEEAGATLRHSAFSSIVSEGNDCTAVLFDANGRELAEPVSFTATSFIGTIPRTMKIFLARHPPATWREGDVLVCNDPWMCTGHLFDICLAVPIFHRKRLVAFSVTCSHTTNIGGAGRMDAQSIYEEGLQIPMTWLYRAGEPQEAVFDFIRANVPLPDQVLGDIRAQVNATLMTSCRVVEIMRELDLDDLNEVSAMIDRTCSSAMRQAIQTLPKGRYEYRLPLEGSEMRIDCAIDIIGDGTLAVDFAGTSPQIRRAVNSPIHYTLARVFYALKAVLLPQTPGNESTFSGIKIDVPLGCILNPERPFPNAYRSAIGHFVPSAVMGALSLAAPDRVIAEGAGASWQCSAHGDRPGGGKFFAQIPLGCGQGASANHNGMDVITYPGNAANAPIEIVERQTGLRFETKELRRDSGGAGKSRGGWGQKISFRAVGTTPVRLSISSGRTTIPASGLAGGGQGAVGHVLVNGKPIDPNKQLFLQPGELVTLETPGGGGYGQAES